MYACLPATPAGEACLWPELQSRPAWCQILFVQGSGLQKALLQSLEEMGSKQPWLGQKEPARQKLQAGPGQLACEKTLSLVLEHGQIELDLQFQAHIHGNSCNWPLCGRTLNALSAAAEPGTLLQHDSSLLVLRGNAVPLLAVPQRHISTPPRWHCTSPALPKWHICLVSASSGLPSLVCRWVQTPWCTSVSLAHSRILYK